MESNLGRMREAGEHGKGRSVVVRGREGGGGLLIREREAAIIDCQLVGHVS